VDLHYFVTPWLAVSGGAGTHSFLDRFEGVMRLNDSDVFGTHFRTTRLFPLSVGLTAVPLPRAPVSPYAGLRTGAVMTERRVDVGLYTFGDNRWHWMAMADLGLVVPLRSFLLHGGVRYLHATASGTGPSQSFVSIQAGVGF
jgi:hypothetical protein